MATSAAVEPNARSKVTNTLPNLPRASLEASGPEIALALTEKG
jgi:hypothetical protein